MARRDGDVVKRSIATIHLQREAAEQSAAEANNKALGLAAEAAEAARKCAEIAQEAAAAKHRSKEAEQEAAEAVRKSALAEKEAIGTRSRAEEAEKEVILAKRKAFDVDQGAAIAKRICTRLQLWYATRLNKKHTFLRSETMLEKELDVAVAAEEHAKLCALAREVTNRHDLAKKALKASEIALRDFEVQTLSPLQVMQKAAAVAAQTSSP
jgi:hypothetical protein